MSSSTVTPPAGRIQLVDALRGFALAGIIIFHNLSHFNFESEPVYNPQWLQPIDQLVRIAFTILFCGKAYAIFSMLFGFSFWIQYSNRKRKGQPFSGRFAWRMLLLFGFGLFHTLFYNGDILTVYAVFSGILLVTRKWSDRSVFWLSLFLLLQPLEWGRLLLAWISPDYALAHRAWDYDDLLNETRINGPILHMMWLNLTYGQLANASFIWEYGRFCQIPGLFLLGMLFARKRMFSEINAVLWKSIGGGSFAVTAILFLLLTQIDLFHDEGGPAEYLGTIFWMYSSLAMALLMLSLIALGWRAFTRFRHFFGIFAPYGRMSMSNYISQSIIGTTLYFGYGLALYPYCGATLSMLLALLVLVLQMSFSRWWLSRYRQGPLEWLWKKATWMHLKKNPPEAIPAGESAR